MRRLLTLMLGLGLAGAANAAGFQAKTMRETLPTREVERPLIIGKGWAEFGIGTDVKTAIGQWDSNGAIDAWNDARWLYTTQRLAIRYGISRRGELFWTFRTHYVELENAARDTTLTQFGLGDPHFGYRYELFRSLAPVTSVVVYGDYKGPAANESPGNYVGGPNTFTSVILTTGTPDLELGLAGKRQLGPAALTLTTAYVRRFSSVVQYVVETELYQGAGRIKPGDLVKIDGEVLLQLGPVALDAGALFTLRQATKLGQTAPGLNPGKELVVQEGSDGWALDARAGAIVNLTRGVDLVGGVALPLRGEDLMYFPIEDIHPTFGPTFSGTIEFRY